MSNEVLIALFSFLSGGIGSFLTFLLSKRGKNAEAKQKELNNVELAIKLWRETAEQNAELQNQKIEILMKQNKQLISQNSILNKKITRLEKDLLKLTN